MAHQTTIITIMSKIAICEHGTSCKLCCWVWQGNKDRYGYGKCRFNKRYGIPHRVIFQYKEGIALHRTQLVLHTCDNPPCCNWNHLYVGDNKQNSDDRMKRGRHNSGYRPKGTEQAQSVLNEQSVRQIRRLYHSGSWTINDLHRVFNVGRSVIQRILTYQEWAWMKGEVRANGT